VLERPAEGIVQRIIGELEVAEQADEGREEPTRLLSRKLFENVNSLFANESDAPELVQSASARHFGR
jgi:hypothetical protein